jgi:hypothetical protein
VEHLESGEARRFTSIEDLSAFMAYWARGTEDRRFTAANQNAVSRATAGECAAVGCDQGREGLAATPFRRPRS